jgi:hypothetical protein
MNTVVKSLLLAFVLSLPLLLKAQVNYVLTTNGAVVTADVTSSPNASGNVIVADTYGNYPVVSIQEDAFANCTSLTGITISTNVTSIGDYAFYNCSGLAALTLGSGVVSIGNYTFNGCSSLTSVTMDNNITSVGIYAFASCYYLASVTISTNVTSIGNYTFYNCSSLGSVTIPTSVTSLGAGVFSACDALTNIAVAAPNPVFSSTNGVLFNKAQTTLIQCPAGLAGSYTIPGSVTALADHAFFSCSSLVSVQVPNSLIIIGTNAFASCSSLTNVALGTGVTSIEYEAFASCSSLAGITIPGNVISIGADAFFGCSGLTSMFIPANVTSIGDYAFSFCGGLTNVTIGSGVANVGVYAFANCNNLKQAYFLGNAPRVDGILGSQDATVFSSFAIETGAVYYYPGTSGWGSTFGGWPTVEVFAPPQISGATLQGGNFGFNITGVSSQLVTVVASTNLVNWQTVWTNTLSGTSTNFTDTQWKNYPLRFYRAH